MFQRIVDDIKDSTSSAVRQASLTAIAGFALLIAIAFLCAAGFIYMLQNYGAIIACIAGCVLFLVVTLSAFVWSTALKQQHELRARQRRAKTARSPLIDPALVISGVQLARALGVKRLLPLLAIGGLALGLLASRGGAQDDVEDEGVAGDDIQRQAAE
jgi:membrane associated rhomboid family serine protease